MKYNRSVYKSLVMISQLGISMLAPVILCTAAGMFLEDHFHIPVTVPLIFLGILAGARNTYVLAQHVARSQKDRERDVPSGVNSPGRSREEEHDDGKE